MDRALSGSQRAPTPSGWRLTCRLRAGWRRCVCSGGATTAARLVCSCSPAKVRIFPGAERASRTPTSTAGAAGPAGRSPRVSCGWSSVARAPTASAWARATACGSSASSASPWQGPPTRPRPWTCSAAGPRSPSRRRAPPTPRPSASSGAGGRLALQVTVCLCRCARPGRTAALTSTSGSQLVRQASRCLAVAITTKSSWALASLSLKWAGLHSTSRVRIHTPDRGLATTTTAGVQMGRGI
mmetsp:Transcript_21/g.58  ORF Transcript_21/g.58 Transcript_21/m.58 type:complete len:241 (+) Transcript_21:1282-2004(+)